MWPFKKIISKRLPAKGEIYFLRLHPVSCVVEIGVEGRRNLEVSCKNLLDAITIHNLLGSHFEPPSFVDPTFTELTMGGCRNVAV